jgi:heme oxygenase
MREPLLARRLRDATREAHGDAEKAFDLDSRTASRHEYAALLVALHDFHSCAEDRLRSVGGWDALRPPVDLSARERTGLLEQDLESLAVPVPSAAVPVELPSLDGLPAALGCLYVLEGSRLGGALVARRAVSVLGPDLPVAFFSGGRRPTGADWRSLQRSLDWFGAVAGHRCADTVVATANQTFSALVDCLRPRVLPS